MDGITFEMMMDPQKHGLTQCPKCGGYGSCLRELSPRCSQCGGSGLVRRVNKETPVQAPA
jgi:DnaJ-class molecular chaperone